MFQKGEYIVCGSSGICEVTDITTVDVDGISKSKLYYALVPCRQKSGRLLIPVDTDKTVIRKIISKEDAMALIDDLPNLEEIWNANDKMREFKYKECIRSCDCQEWLRVIKTLYLRQKERIAEGKRITVTDERYLKLAEEYLYSELSVLLGVDEHDVGHMVKERLREK